jgi:hypothetical protein
MNYEYLKSKLEKFFQDTPTEYLVERLEQFGYVFIEKKYNPTKIKTEQVIKLINNKELAVPKNSWFARLFNKEYINLDEIGVIFCDFNKLKY